MSNTFSGYIWDILKKHIDMSKRIIDLVIVYISEKKKFSDEIKSIFELFL
jgi:hypothetical protein